VFGNRKGGGQLWKTLYSQEIGNVTKRYLQIAKYNSLHIRKIKNQENGPEEASPSPGGIGHESDRNSPGGRDNNSPNTTTTATTGGGGSVSPSKKEA
jgi:hypothetical protein